MTPEERERFRTGMRNWCGRNKNESAADDDWHA
jgi:hypothetical protein